MISYDALYLSPHLDDAALSCGGQIHRLAREGRRVLVVTLHAGDPGEPSPLARELHRVWKLGEEGMDVRRREDEAATAVLGVDAIRWDLRDALYRRHPRSGEPLYPSLEALFGSPHPAEEERFAELGRRLGGLPPADVVRAPLGAGRHVDHVLTRRAAESVLGDRLELYEDYPYARSFWVRRKALGWPWGWRSRVLELSEPDLDAKCRAIACYSSQLSPAFDGEEDMERQVRDFARRVGGERLWLRR